MTLVLLLQCQMVSRIVLCYLRLKWQFFFGNESKKDNAFIFGGLVLVPSCVVSIINEYTTSLEDNF